jgi:hypothetical protein
VLCTWGITVLLRAGIKRTREAKKLKTAERNQETQT